MVYSAVFYYFRQMDMQRWFPLNKVGLLMNYSWNMSIKFTSLVTLRRERMKGGLRSLHGGNSLRQGVKLLTAGYTPKRTWTSDTGHQCVSVYSTFGVCKNTFTRSLQFTSHVWRLFSCVVLCSELCVLSSLTFDKLMHTYSFIMIIMWCCRAAALELVETITCLRRPWQGGYMPRGRLLAITITCHSV